MGKKRRMALQKLEWPVFNNQLESRMFFEFLKFGAAGRTRTVTSFDIRPSNVEGSIFHIRNFNDL
jgi:hypothetical protein